MCAFSSSEGKQLFKDFLDHIARPLGLKSFMDIGCGAGQYAEIIRSVYGKEAFIHGVEVFEEYITRHNLLGEKYDVVLNQDIRDICENLNAYDVVICGDLLEHLTKEEAIRVVNVMRGKCKFFWGALPVKINRPWSYGYNQGPDEWVENPANEHLWNWTGEEIQECFKPLWLVPFLATGTFLVEGDLGIQ